MPVYLHDLKTMKLYKKKFYLPIVKTDKKKGSAILLLTPNYQSSLALMNYPFAINISKNFRSYYVEKDITYVINNEHRLQIDHYDTAPTVLNEQASVYTEVTDVTSLDNPLGCSINEMYCQLGDKVIFFNEMYDEELLSEASNYNSKYKRLLYNDRIRNDKQMFAIYRQVKQDNPDIQFTFIRYNRYKNKNLYIDLNYYNGAYLHNNTFNPRTSSDMYFEFLRRVLCDRRIVNAGYTKRTVFIPLVGWGEEQGTNVYDFLKNVNPISAIYKKLKLKPNDIVEAFKGLDFVFVASNGYFRFDPTEVDHSTKVSFIRLITKLLAKEPIEDNEVINSKDAIVTSIVDKIEKSKGVEIHNLTGNASGTDADMVKSELVKKVADAAENSVDEDETLNKMEDEDIKKIIMDLENNADTGVKISATRANRITRAQDELMNKKVNNTSVKDMITKSNVPKELPETELPIKTINDDWKHLKAINFEKTYDVNADIVKCLNSLSDMNKEYPVSILNIDVENTSTTEDLKDTYTVKCESYSGKRFTLKFDIPRFRDGRYMRLRGNDKIFSGELTLLPISKTNGDTVQIATLYNKIFVQTYYTSLGKSNPATDILIKALDKYTGKNIEVVLGDNTNVSSKYELPIDYVDLSTKYSKIKFKSKNNGLITFYFNQDEIRNMDKSHSGTNISFPYAYAENKVVYYPEYDGTFSEYLSEILCQDEEFASIYHSCNPGKKYTYSRASILSTYIPVIVILAHNLGLTKALEMANIKYEISDKKKSPYDIKFSDGYISYENTYNSIMLMNGLRDCNTEDYPIAAINSKITWVEMLDNFGGRIKSDGLDNFKDLMVDPISAEVCRSYQLPDNYYELLIYANNMLADNKYTKHVDITTNRYRTNEVIAAQFYRVLSASYKDYALQNKHGRDSVMYIKQSAVIDLTLSQNTTSDLSIFQPLSEVESKNSVSTKGVTGMNTERGYGMDKRGYDKSMLNVIAQATGFASTVGINRQMTIDPGITGGRGYIKQSTEDDISVTKSLSMTEALSVFEVTSDDPFRNFMTDVQTAKHTTPIVGATAQLVTTGADAAMPYLTSDMFCHKAKKKGKVKEIVPGNYLIVQYDDGGTEFVSLAERTMKNSDGGFYIPLELKTDLKVGSPVKENTILAYDYRSFSKKVGDCKQLAYNLGCIAKVAIIDSEDGYEDSGKTGNWLSEAMASDIVICKDLDLPAATNLLYMVKKGQKITEGDPLVVFQNAYDDADANLLLKSLNTEEGDDITEIGRNSINSKVTGVISDIKLYRTVDLDELSDSLKKVFTAREREINRVKKLADQSENDTYALFDPTEKLEQEGKLKNVDGVRISIYMKYHDKLSVGDKLVVNNANKVVIMDTFDDKDSPYTDLRPNEEIDVISSCSAIDGRMITSNFKLGGLYKALIELSRKSKEIMGLKWKTIHEMNKF